MFAPLIRVDAEPIGVEVKLDGSVIASTEFASAETILISPSPVLAGFPPVTIAPRTYGNAVRARSSRLKLHTKKT